ncbi:nucleolar MIF4G domain-containing protein 1 [Protopterus annectens]|uniref:nucleolar MIF4G domain-containing protein 1 n=1 Tax=Protopterus annectens TaxID=7888 RepID=UPI001CFACD7A|nr:nucleolar MIF4G domain-containing protein 1 [Protopterus annectens]
MLEEWLSEPNFASISGQLEELYMTHSRKDMNETLTDILLSACVTPAMMPDRLLMEHVFLVSILHYTVGLEVGAHFLEAVVKKFDEVHRSGSEGKVCNNLIALLAHLYNFHVVHSVLIFEILKILLDSFTEKDIEIILFLLKNVGFSLRKDDALALKELISEAQKKAGMNKELVDQSRVRFMLETMLALKNNDMRKIPGYDPEPVERLRKLQRSMLHNNGGGKEAQLHVTFENILNADQTGRWWIVGSSWSGTPMISNADSISQLKLPGGKVSSKILELARKQRMNTDIRRTIFCVMMTSEDFLEAFENLLRLGLKDHQEREIVHVLIDCCLQEKTFNAFYAILGDKFCNYDRRFQMTFQFSMWDKFRELENLSDTAFSNLGDLLAHLLKKKSLSLSVFKVIEFSELDKPKVRLLRHILRKLLMETGPEELAAIFGRISGIPKLGLLCEGLKLFISHFLLKNSHGSSEEVSLLKEQANVAEKALQAKDSKLKL